MGHIHARIHTQTSDVWEAGAAGGAVHSLASSEQMPNGVGIRQ